MLEATKVSKLIYKLVIFDWEGTLAKGNGSLIDGVRELLELLIHNGFTCAIATSMSLSRLQDLIVENALQSYFRYLQSADGGTIKPDPRMLTQLLMQTAFNANEALMVGDSVYDMLMAQDAHIDAIGVLSGADTKERLATAMPQTILETVNDLATYLNLQRCP